MLKLAPIFKPTNAPTRKLRVQSGSYSCPRAWHAKKVRPARQHSHRPASELVKWIFAMMIRVRFQALGVEEHAIKSRRRAGRGAFNAAGMPDLIRPYLVCENLSGGAATTASPRLRVPASLPTLPRKLVRSPPRRRPSPVVS